MRPQCPGMDTFSEPIRTSVSLLAIATAIAMFRVLKGDPRDRAPILRLLAAWLVIASAAGLVVTHVIGGLPAPALVPAGALVGLALALATLFSPRVAARFAALEDAEWRMLMLLRAAFGGLILAAGAAALLPAAFALPAGLGDVLVGAAAILVPGSLAAGGRRGLRLLLFVAGMLDLLGVVVLQVLVLLPWLAESGGGGGFALLLPWVAVPLLAMLNLSGLLLVVKELARAPATIT